jgi:PAS domain S-box-containing protein
MAGGESQIAILDDAPETADGHHLSGDQDQTRSENGGAQVLPFTRTEPNAERMVLDRLPLGVIIYSDDGILYANHAALDLSGRSNVPALKELGQIEALFADGMDEGNGAMTLVRPDGSTLQVTGRVQSVRWDGQSAALLSLREHTPADSETQEASQDASLLAAGAAGVAAGAIAGANASDGALPLVRARIGELEAIIDLASDGVVTLDGEGEIKDLNQAAQALVGYAAEDLIGRPFRLLFPEDSRQTALDYLEDIAGQGRLSLFNEGRELECITAQGGLVPVFMTLGRLTDDEPATYCAVLRDLSPFKQAETDLVEARKAAEEASAHKSDFLARVSHEIRTPLNAVIGFSEVMLEERFGPVGSERYRQYLRDIHTSGEHLMSLLNDLLDLSKIEAAKWNCRSAKSISTTSFSSVWPSCSRRPTRAGSSCATHLCR